MLKHYLISGRVQGVGYRAFTKRTADRLKVTGWVRNLADGRVESLVKGSEEELCQLEVALNQGPPAGQVVQVQVQVVNAPLVCDNFMVLEDGDAEWSLDSQV